MKTKNERAAAGKRSGSNRGAQLDSASNTNTNNAGASAQRSGKNAGKPAFAAFPARMIGDQNCKATHFRAMGGIAFHDRLSDVRKSGKRGQGCWANLKTLALFAGVNLTNLSAAISDLERWGYITVEPHPMNKRTRVYRVIYDQISTETLCPEKSKAEEDQPDNNVEYIPLKREHTLQKQEEIRLKPENILQKQEPYSEKPALANGGWRNLVSDNPVGALAMKARQLRAGGVLLPAERVVVEGILQSECSEEIRHQARRILQHGGGSHG